MAFQLWHYLAESARRHPARPALQHEDTVLTYQELDELSTRISLTLKELGVGRGTRVGLYMPKSWKSVAVVSGISKSGATYVPIDPNAPGARAAYILGDCKVSALITTEQGLARLGDDLASVTSLSAIVLTQGAAAAPNGATVLDWDALTAERGGDAAPPEPGVECDPAFILYTSGSTGFPKGVIISHRNAMAFIDWGAETFGVGPDDRLSNHAPLHFDLSVFDIYVALKCGATVVLVPDKIAAFPAPLTKWIGEEKISVWYSVPSALVRLFLHGGLSEAKFPDLRCVLYAGEPFPVKYLRPVMAAIPGARFFNLYGPTETNVCTYFALPEILDEDVTDVPIGSACANTQVFAVTDEGRVAGVDETGELYARGPTVMLGYWGMQERTQKVVVQNPLNEAYHDPVYRTGDIVRLNADGGYTFLRRRDHMVKSRGYRIELGEIEQALYAHDNVAEAVAVAVPDEEIGSRLYAAVSLREGGENSPNELSLFCAGRLPRYMVPEQIRIEAELPKTSTGKLDRVRLQGLFAGTGEE